MAEVDIDIREVGPRDGLQVEEPIAVADRVRLIEALVGTNLKLFPDTK